MVQEGVGHLLLLLPAGGSIKLEKPYHYRQRSQSNQQFTANSRYLILNILHNFNENLSISFVNFRSICVNKYMQTCNND